MRRFRINLILLAVGVLLTAASVYVVGRGGQDEPYVVFRKSDALLQVGGAMVLMLIWLQLAVAIVAAVAENHVSGWWLSLLVWVLICEFYLFHSLRGYLEDIARYVSPTH